MVMTEVFEKLRLLQGILATKNTLEARILDAPKILNQKEEFISGLKKGYIEKNSRYEELRGTINRLQADLFQVGLQRENAEKAMDTIESQRDYEVLEKRIQDASKEEISIRRRLEGCKVDFEKLDEEIQEEEALISNTESELNESKAKIDEEINQMKEELKELEQKKGELSEGLNDETIFKFERIIKNKHGVGIVPVDGNICTGCHMILPAQFANEIQRSDDLMYCPYCSRVLFYDHTDFIMETSQDAVFDDSNIGGLADLDTPSLDSSM